MSAKKQKHHEAIEQTKTTPLHSKTWLAKTVIRHPDPEGGASYADHRGYLLIEAADEEQARALAMREHCPESYQGADAEWYEGAGGQWVEDFESEDGPPVRAFYLGDESAPVDVGCGHAILWVKPVPADEYKVLQKWLQPGVEAAAKAEAGSEKAPLVRKTGMGRALREKVRAEHAADNDGQVAPPT